MSQICIWCRREWEGITLAGSPVTGNTCLECRERLFQAEAPVSLREYLDQLAAPVLLVDGNGNVVGFNTAAAKLLGKPASQLKGRYGNVVECSYARLAGGCGNTVHCQACTIRRTVASTALTGEPRYQVAAYQDLQTSHGPRETRFVITTEKVGGFVLLRIDDKQAQSS